MIVPEWVKSLYEHQARDPLNPWMTPSDASVCGRENGKEKASIEHAGLVNPWPPQTTNGSLFSRWIPLFRSALSWRHE